MNKDDFPESEANLDEWLDAVEAFNDAFTSLLKATLYLWQIRHLVDTETLTSLLDSVESALKKNCKSCDRTDECNDCPVKEYLDKVNLGKNEIRPN